MSGKIRASGRSIDVGAAPRHIGPPLLVPGVSFAVLSAAAIALSAQTPVVGSSDLAISEFQRTHAAVLSVAGFLQLAAAVPLAVWGATVHSRLHALGAQVTGATIALVGSVLGCTLLGLGGLSSWVTGEVASSAGPEVASVFAQSNFALSGTGYAVAFALLAAGVSVPALVLRLAPRAVSVLGVLVAVAGMVGTLTLLTPVMDFLIPVVRFGGLLWVLLISATLLRRR